MNREANVINYYVICNKLKNVIRTGWMDWNVESERIESVAEHVYGTQMLALAMKSEYQYDIDIMKVIMMLAIHELGECIIGDLTSFQISKEEKIKKEHEAVHKVLEKMIDGKTIEDLFLEFDAHETEEAKFAYFCDKLECDIQCKLYDEAGCVNINNQENSVAAKNGEVEELLKSGKTWSEMWISWGQGHYNYDDNFKAVSNYIMDNKIS
jgi:putative hydrolase of HD superfamily